MSIETYGRYQLLKKLATGGMAQIYLARQVGPEGFEKMLVVKRILPHLAENEEFVTMFLDEARIAARLNHPNVVTIFDLGAQDDTYFIAMEFIHGEDLRRVWKHAERQGQSIPIPLICRIIIEACNGLDYAHKRTDQANRPLNIVHRDISPQNVLVSFEGHVKIADFGIAKAADQATVTKSGVLKGKYSYMAPEQAAGRQLDNGSDIFALGVVAYELLTGTRLFKRANDVQTLNAVSECKVAPPSQVNPLIPPALDAIVMKALSKHRGDRYADMREMGQALEEWLLSNKLPATTVHLAEFMQGIYAERLAKEAEEGSLQFESFDGMRIDDAYLEKATPSVRSARVTRSARTGGSRSSNRRDDAAPADRPSRSGPQTRSRAIERASREGHTEASMPTENERTPRARIAGVVLAGLAVVAGVVGAGVVVFRKAPATLVVQSEPTGAQVRLNGQLLACRTPCTLEDQPEGAVALELTMPGFTAVTANVEIPRTGELIVPLSLKPEPKAAALTAVTVEAVPEGAVVSINGEQRGVAPVTVSLAPGTRTTVSVFLEGYVEVSDTFTVSGPEATKRYTLKPEAADTRPPEVVKVNRKPDPKPEVKPPPSNATGLVSFVVQPWAEVDCGPAYRFGATPFPKQAMSVGEHRCTFSNPELGKQTRVVRVAADGAGRAQVVKVNLAKP